MRDLPKKDYKGSAGRLFFMATLMDPVVEDGDAIYGWCGLCHTFAEFPHECAGKDSPAQDQSFR